VEDRLRFQIAGQPVRVAAVACRIALAAGFFSAVADRFGLWGAPGARHVAWGDWQHFVAYTGSLNWFVPGPVVPALAAVATLAELALGILLLVGYQFRWTAYASAVLLLLFATTMTIANGLKAPLDYSVFAAAAAAFLLGANATDAASGGKG
jgi:uncharacterized membrane protein YphA (DoxX/SURF4 family)